MMRSSELAPDDHSAAKSSIATEGRSTMTNVVCVNPAVVSSSCTKSMVKKQSPSERLQRSRERNRMHARKTRQRKKEHIQCLQQRAEELKQEQLQMRQLINEKNTASILVGLFSKIDKRDRQRTENPMVEELLLRPVDEIPDASKIPELPALILPGQHHSKKGKGSACSTDSVESAPQHDMPDDGIDYELLGKDRSTCTPAELDKIRRERNRMHAKRTRDRKRLFMEEMEELIKKLQDENELLENHLRHLDEEHEKSSSVTPSLTSSSFAHTVNVPSTVTMVERDRQFGYKPPMVTADQIKSLLLAACSFDKRDNCAEMTTISSVASAVSASTNASGNSSLCDNDDVLSNDPTLPFPKRQRLQGSNNDPSQNIITSAVPISITTTSTAAVGY